MRDLLDDWEEYNKPIYKKKSFKIILIAWLIFVLVFVFYIISWAYPMDRDFYSQLERAQTAAEAETMYNYVNQAITTLEHNNQIHGHCALVFKTAQNDLEAQYMALTNVRTRLMRTMEFNKNGVEYQSAIDDIRGTLREINYIDCWIWHFD